MMKSSKNQMANAIGNPYQGSAKKVLCVCSAGMLRSPTIAATLSKVYGYNTRSCGLNQDFALIPISEALYTWADEIVCASQGNLDELLLMAGEAGLNTSNTDFKVLHIPDEYSFMDEALVAEITNTYKVTDPC